MSLVLPRLLPAVLLAIAGLTACAKPADPPKVPLERVAAELVARKALAALSPQARAALDAGNAAYRAGRYDAALAQYRAAAIAAPDQAAPHYGIYMVAVKMGNTPLADSATAAVRQRANPADLPPDSALRGAHVMPGAHAVLASPP